MSRKQLMKEMDAQEVLKWMAYEMSIDPDKNKEYMKEIELDRQKKQTLAEESARIKAFLMSLGTA